MSIIEQTRKFVKESFKGHPLDQEHAELTFAWIKKMKPNAGEALKLAGLLHDIERAIYGDWKKGSTSKQAVIKHQSLSAKEAEKFLRTISAKDTIVSKVRRLIKTHEQGGSDEADTLCNADCLALMEGKATKWAEKCETAEDVIETRKKLIYIYNRITTNELKEVADKWYKEALAILKQNK